MPGRNERLLELVLRSEFRESLVPAAAVIPAELDMGNVVAVKTYVVTELLVCFFLMLYWGSLQLLELDPRLN